MFTRSQRLLTQTNTINEVHAFPFVFILLYNYMIVLMHVYIQAGVECKSTKQLVSDSNDPVCDTKVAMYAGVLFSFTIFSWLYSAKLAI